MFTERPVPKGFLCAPRAIDLFGSELLRNDGSVHETKIVLEDKVGDSAIMAMGFGGTV